LTQQAKPQTSLSDYDKRAAHFSITRARIMKIVTATPGLTVAEVSTEYLLRYKYLPRIGNRIRELRRLGWVETVKEDDGLLHVYPVKEEQAVA